MTEKQQRFCQEYLIDLNTTQAAIRAGYSKKTTNEQAARKLAKVSIQKHLQILMDKRSGRTQVDADRVVRELACIAFSDIRDYTECNARGVTLIDSENWTDDQAAPVSSSCTIN